MGILYLIFLCSCIIFFSSLAISQYEKKSYPKLKSLKLEKDPFFFLFNVYDK